MNTMPEWERDLRNALVTPDPPGGNWIRPSRWTIERAVEAVRSHMTLPNILEEADHVADHPDWIDQYIKPGMRLVEVTTSHDRDLNQRRWAGLDSEGRQIKQFTDGKVLS